MPDLNGLDVMTPTSIAYSGTSASINTDKSVSFTAVTSLSLNGVFTSSYDNYMIVMRFTVSAIDQTMRYRLRASGTDNSTASSYVSQLLRADTTTVNGARATLNTGVLPEASNFARNGVNIYVFGPKLTQYTSARAVDVGDKSDVYIYDVASTHNQATSYDGITIYPESNNMTGLLTVFGYKQ